MAVGVVDVEVQVKGMNDVARLTKRLDALEKEVQQLRKGLPAVANGIKQTGRAAATASGNIQRLGVAFRTTLAPLVAITAAVSFFGKSLSVASNRRADVLALADALGRVGGTNKDLERLSQAANKFGNTTLFNQEDFTAAAVNLTSFADLSVDQFDRIINIAADVAQKTGGSVKEATTQLAKALNAPEQNLSALSRAGIQFTKAEQDVIKSLSKANKTAEAQSLILKKLEVDYGGAAKAAAGGFAGSLDTLGENFRDLQEGVGRNLQSVLKPFVDGLGAIFSELNKLQPAIGLFINGFGKIVNAFKPITDAIFGNIDVWGLFRDALIMTYKVAAVVMNDIAFVISELAKGAAKIINQMAKGVANFFGGIADSSAQGMKLLVQNVANGLRKVQELFASLINAAGGPSAAIAKLFGFDIGAFIAAPIGAAADALESGYAYAEGVINRAKQLELPGVDVNTRAGSAVNNTTGTGKAGGGGGGGGSKGSDELAKQLELQKKQLEAANQLLTAAEQRSAILNAENELQEINIQATIDQNNTAKKYNDLLKKSLSNEESQILLNAKKQELKNIEIKQEQDIAELRKGAVTSIKDEIGLLNAKLQGLEKEYLQRQEIAALVEAGGGTVSEAQAAALVTQRDALKEQVAEMEKIDDLTNQIYNVFAGSMKDAIKGLIDGTKDLSDILSDMLGQLGDLFLNLAFNQLGSALKIPGFASGGRPPVNQPSLVGEAGPELFVPDTAGTIISNQDMTTAMGRWNSGRNADSNIEQLGDILNSAESGSAAAAGSSTSYSNQTQFHSSQSITQGNSSANYNSSSSSVSNSSTSVNNAGSAGSDGSIHFSLETTVINGVEYATVDQVRAMGASATKEGAKLGEARTLGRLRSSTAARKKIGMK